METSQSSQSIVQVIHCIKSIDDDNNDKLFNTIISKMLSLEGIYDGYENLSIIQKLKSMIYEYLFLSSHYDGQSHDVYGCNHSISNSK